jgi:hypothetical protein
MGKLISQAEGVIERFKKEGKVSYIEFTPDQHKEMIEDMKKIQDEYRRKSAASWRSARDIILD